MTHLRDYQETGVSALVSGRSKYLGDEQGLGKTLQLIETAKRLDVKRLLVVCPASVKLVWQTELRKWWPESPRVVVVNGSLRNEKLDGPVVVIINYDRLSQSRTGFDFVGALTKSEPFDLMLLDEAHLLKTPSSLRTKAVYGKLIGHAKRTIPASGTPAPNHAGELYTMLRAIAPETIEKSNGSPMSLVEFEDMFCVVENRPINGRPVRVIRGSRNMEILRAKLSTFMLRRLKKNVLTELPPLQFVTVPITPSAAGLKEIAEYETVLSPGMSDDEVLEALKTSDEHFMRLRAILGLAKANAAVAYLHDFLVDTKAKIVVWAEHQRVIDTLMFGLRDFHPVKIDGRDSQADRQRAVASFLEVDKNRVFVGNIQAAATGLTLIGDKFPCRDEFFVETSFTPANNLQAACRIHRIGQRDGVLARVLTAAGTLDDRIQSILVRKTTELSALFF